MSPKVTEIPLTTPVGRLDGHTLLEFEGGHAVLWRRGDHMDWDGIGWFGQSALTGFSPERSLGDLAGLVARQEPRRAFSLPAGHVVPVPAWFGDRRWVRPLLILAASTVLVVILDIWLHPHVTKVVGVLGTVVLVLGSLALLWAVGANLFSGARMVYWTGWRRWEFAELAALGDRDDLARRQIEAVKQEYGRLRSDLTYRIENSALFDATCPTTETFQLALVEWDTAGEHLNRMDQAALASRVVAMFRHARHHAEQVGMHHLPTTRQRAARRAVKALRVAMAPHTIETERVAALERAVALLDGLVLHHLPTGAEIRRAVPAQHRRELPGRRST